MPHHIQIHSNIVIEPPLSKEHFEYLKAFAHTRRMFRNELAASNMPDPLREAVGLPIGPGGAYFVNGMGYRGQDVDDSVDNPNEGPDSQPSVFCGWLPNEDGNGLYHDKESGDSDEVLEWLRYIIVKFLTPWGYSVIGRGICQGEDIENRHVFEIRGTAVVTRDVGGFLDIPGDEGKTVSLVVLDDGDTYSGLEGCVVVEVPASQIDVVYENPKILRDAEVYGWKVTHIADLL